MKITNLHANLIVATLWLSAIYFYLMLTYPFNVVEMKLNENGRLPIKSDKVVAGEDLVIFLEFDKKMHCSPDIQYFLIDGFVLKLSESSITRPLGENKIERIVNIPLVAPANKKVNIRIEYKCELNKLRTINYSWETEYFEIIKE